MLNFKTYIEEALVNKIDNNTKGVMHELLTGYYLNKGKHMPKHIGKTGESAEDTYNRYSKTIHPTDLKTLHSRAKSAAEDIRKQAEVNGHKVHSVHWTSKPGDLHKSTGIHATQKEDPSDIVVSTSHGGSGKNAKHHGVSLKVSDKTAKVPSSSLGMASASSNAKDMLAKHKKEITSMHPGLGAPNKAARKAFVKSNPAIHNKVKEKNRTFLANMAKSHATELQNKIKSGKHDEVVKHVREVLHAHNTPMQGSGHNHIKHTTYETAKGAKHATENPGQDYEHILKDPKNISVEHSGSQVIFKHKGKKFASQAHKFDSQSDPLSSLKSAGRSHLSH